MTTIILLIAAVAATATWRAWCIWKLEKESTKEFNEALKCIDDLVELGKNKTDENIAQFKSKWPNYIPLIVSFAIRSRVAIDKGVWKLFCELAKESTKED